MACSRFYVIRLRIGKVRHTRFLVCHACDLNRLLMFLGFLSDDCDDTIVELSKLSIADSDHDITVVDKVHGERLTTARDYVLRRCNQTDAILFDECYPDPWVHRFVLITVITGQCFLFMLLNSKCVFTFSVSLACGNGGLFCVCVGLVFVNMFISSVNNLRWPLLKNYRSAKCLPT